MFLEILCGVATRIFSFCPGKCRGRHNVEINKEESMSDRREFIRSGTAALDRLNKYLNYHCMPLVSSKYWPMTHGTTPGG